MQDEGEERRSDWRDFLKTFVEPVGNARPAQGLSRTCHANSLIVLNTKHSDSV